MDKEVIGQFEEKLNVDMLPYETLQYIQSFVARKKKHITTNTASALVYSGAKKLIESDSPGDAGTLLLWFIEGGAGEAHPFHIEAKEIEGSDDLYCDVERLIKLIKKLDEAKIAQICEKIYIPLAKLITKAKPQKHTSLLDRVTFIEDIFADVFESVKNWQYACRALFRLEDMERLAKLLLKWSSEGFVTEKPLFFARAVLHLLADGQTQLALKLIKESSELVIEQEHVDSTGNPYASLAIWHLAIILGDLVSITARPGPDKGKIFKQLNITYGSIVSKSDPKLLPLLQTIGEKQFGVISDTPLNPLEALMGGKGGAGKTGTPPLDMAKMMQMMQQMRR